MVKGVKVLRYDLTSTASGSILGGDEMMNWLTLHTHEMILAASLSGNGSEKLKRLKPVFLSCWEGAGPASCINRASVILYKLCITQLASFWGYIHTHMSRYR
jgi:hypothetical protein